jgi:glycosyltransferase involved in cell wall biosynthesis
MVRQSTLDLLVDRPQTVLLAILTDLSIDHRCFKVATSLREAGMHPVILCDRPLRPLGEAWSGFAIRILSQASHLEHFARAFAVFHLRLAFVLLFTRAKVWVALDCPPLLTLAVMGRLRGATVIYDSHELFTQTPLVLSRPSRRRFWTFWHDAGLKLTRRVIAVSPTCVQWFHRHYPGHQVFLLPNAPSLRDDAQVAQKPHDAPRLTFQGGLRVASGLRETFVALAGAPALAAFTLDIYGDGPERKNLEAAARHAGVTPRLVFHGQVPFEALREPMGRAHIGVHLMQPICESFALTLANKLFDYAHAGLPVLLSDNPAHRAFLQKHPVGVAVDSHSPEAIALGLQDLAEHWDTYHAACLKAREVWNWQAFARDLPAFIASGKTNGEPFA